MRKNLGTGRPRAVAAMSGGVDSAVAAALMLEAGYEVVGITLRLHDRGTAGARAGTCCSGRDETDARRAARHLGIPHYVLDYESRFQAAVIDDFADTYVAGETPVPCVRCNERVKFRDLLHAAREFGAEALATGHYAQRLEGPRGVELHAAADGECDQSYFLFATSVEQLSFLRFPLGALPKSETRARARELGLSVADKPDSQDLCFVPDGNYAATVKRLRPEADRPGEVVDARSGRVLGAHAGIVHFTVGQRRGLGVGGREPLYVLRLEPATARVIVGPRAFLGVRRFAVDGVNWLDRATPYSRRAHVRVRSTRPARPATVLATGDASADIALDEPEEGVAPGQACVLYDGARVLGGGWIRRSEPRQPTRPDAGAAAA